MQNLQAKPVGIKIIGIFLIVISSLAIGPSFLCYIVFRIIGFDDKLNSLPFGNDAMSEILRHVPDFALFELTVGIIYLVAAIYLLKYKLWANRLLTFCSIILPVISWLITYWVYQLLGGQRFFLFKIWDFFSFVTSFIITIISIVFILALNRKKTLAHFE